MSRLVAIGLPALFLGLGALGCERRDPVDPHEFVAEETARVARAQPAAVRDEARVSCRCDADAGLHVTAPAGSIVTVPPDAARTDAEANIVVVSEPERDREQEREAPGTRLRHTVSLGYVGDGPLTDVHSAGYDDGGYYAPAPYYAPSPYYGGVSHRYGGTRYGGTVGAGPHGSFHGGSAHGSFHGGTMHGTFGGGGAHATSHGGGGHGGGGRGGGGHGR